MLYLERWYKLCHLQPSTGDFQWAIFRLENKLNLSAIHSPELPSMTIYDDVFEKMKIINQFKCARHGCQFLYKLRRDKINDLI